MAAAQYKEKTAVTRADWLSAKAREVMNSDPDLPWLLIDEA
jgi:hypothetical protein